MPSKEDIEVGRIFAELYTEGSPPYTTLKAALSLLFKLRSLTRELMESTARNALRYRPMPFGEAFDKYLATPQGRKARTEIEEAIQEASQRTAECCAKWREQYGMDPPKTIEDLTRQAVRAGLDTNVVYAKQWYPREILPVIEGYLLRLQDRTKRGKRGRPPKDVTKQRADFACKMLDKGISRWAEILEAYRKHFPNDKAATTDVIYKAYHRNYPAK